MTDYDQRRCSQMKVKLLFRIEKITPDRMAAAEMAEYMTKLARLLGARDHVHFTAIRDASVGIEAEIGYRGRSVVRKRMRDAGTGADPDVRRHWNEINGQLARRRLSAKLQEVVEDRAPVVRVIFPGAEGLLEALPPIKDRVRVIGTLYRLEGRDRTAHAGVEDDSGTYSVTMTREQARAIAPHMFQEVRVEGLANLTRDPDGRWQIGEIAADRIEPLVDTSLAETVEHVRQIGGFGWTEDPDGLDAVQRERDSQ